MISVQWGEEWLSVVVSFPGVQEVWKHSQAWSVHIGFRG